MNKDFDRAESWLRRAVRTAPHPLPPGRFPQLLQQAEHAGFSHELMGEVVDLWLAYDYCRITDQVTNDVALTESGVLYFGGVLKDDKKSK